MRIWKTPQEAKDNDRSSPRAAHLDWRRHFMRSKDGDFGAKRVLLRVQTGEIYTFDAFILRL